MNAGKDKIVGKSFTNFRLPMELIPFDLFRKVKVGKMDIPHLLHQFQFTVLFDKTDNS